MKKIGTKWFEIFFAHHQSESPYFKDISKEFLDYIQNEREPRPEDPAFIQELAHYEWLEIYLTFIDIEPDLTNVDTAGDLLNGIPVLSPLVQVHSYSFPVHKLKPGFKPTQADEKPNFLMVHRDKQDKVSFLELNPITAMLINMISETNTKTGQELLDDIVDQTNPPNPETVYTGGIQTLKLLRTKEIVLGIRK